MGANRRFSGFALNGFGGTPANFPLQQEVLWHHLLQVPVSGKLGGSVRIGVSKKGLRRPKAESRLISVTGGQFQIVPCLVSMVMISTWNTGIAANHPFPRPQPPLQGQNLPSALWTMCRRALLVRFTGLHWIVTHSSPSYNLQQKDM